MRSVMGGCVLSLERLTVRRAGRMVLRDVSLEITPGQCVLLQGVNGCGKSTLVESVIGLHSAASGRIRVRRFEGAHRWAGIGWARQYVQATLPISVDEYLIGPKYAYISGMQETGSDGALDILLERCGLLPLRASRFGTLSAGNARMAEIVRAFSYGRHLLLLDEPTASLEANRVTLLGALLKDYCESGGACLVVTHRAEWLREVETTNYVLREGKLIAGT